MSRIFGSLRLGNPNTPALPSVGYGSDDMAILLGMWAPAVSGSTVSVVKSRGVLTLNDVAVTGLYVRDAIS